MTKPKFEEKDLLIIEDAIQALDGLDENHFAIIEQQSIDAEKKLNEWSDFLSILNAYDQIRDTAVQKLRRGSWRNFGGRIAIRGSIIITVIYIILLLIEIAPPAWVFFSAIGLCIGAGIIYRYSPRGQKFATLNSKLKRIEKLDFPNLIRAYAMPLVDFLKEECKSDTSLKLFFNFKSRHFENGDDTLKPGYKTRNGYGLLRTEFSNYELLKVYTKLHDGSVLIYQLDDQVRKRVFSRSKYSASGKYKTKTKYKYKAKIAHSLRLSVPKKLYSLNTSIPPSQDIFIDLTENEKRYIFKLKGTHYLKTNLSSTYQPDLEDMFRLVSEVYKRLDKIEQTS